MGFHINHRHWGLCHLLSTHYIRLPVTWAANCYDFSDIFLAHHLLVHTVADLAHSGPIHGMRGRSRSRSSWCCAKCGCRSIEHEFSSGSSVHIWHASTICASGRLVHADRQESSLLHESVVSTGEPPCTHSLNHSLSLSLCHSTGLRLAPPLLDEAWFATAGPVGLHDSCSWSAC